MKSKWNGIRVDYVLSDQLEEILIEKSKFADEYRIKGKWSFHESDEEQEEGGSSDRESDYLDSDDV